MSETVDIKRVQNRLLEMAKEIASVLETHDIPHFITHGTLLGAVRHGGFIPWDDDFDFYLFDDTYDDVLSMLRAELTSSLFVEDEDTEPLFFHGWARVKDKRTIVHSNRYVQDNIYKNRGLTVDLFRTKKIRIMELPDWIASENLRYLDSRLRNNLITETEYKNRVKLILESKLTVPAYVRTDDRYVYGRFSKSEKPFMEIDELYPLKKMKFEDTYFYAPKDVDALLRSWYGDYMTLPSEVQRVGHYDSVEFLE